MTPVTTPPPRSPEAANADRCASASRPPDHHPLLPLPVAQKISGSAFRVNAMIEAARLTLVAGEPGPVRGAEATPGDARPTCGVIVWSHNAHLGEAIAFVGAGVLDEGERLRPEAHYFTRSEHAWVTLPPDVPAFEQLGDPGKAGSRERVMAALASVGPGSGRVPPSQP